MNAKLTVSEQKQHCGGRPVVETRTACVPLVVAPPLIFSTDLLPPQASLTFCAIPASIHEIRAPDWRAGHDEADGAA
jgi:hypothetical protein